jgi:REP element-mobilizing transposase RayT
MRRYNPHIHHRKSIRLKGYDYARAGLYFITICCHERERLFGEVVNGRMELNAAGKTADECWKEIPAHFPHVILHEHIIMPNHVHGIIELQNINHVGAKNISPHADREMNAPHEMAPNVNDDSYTNNISVSNTGAKNISHHFNEGMDAPDNGDSAINNISVSNTGAKNFSPLRSPSKTVGSVVRGFKIGVTKWMRENTNVHTVWQRNYFEHNIRDEQSYHIISNYIKSNPSKWEEDDLYRE